MTLIRDQKKSFEEIEKLPIRYWRKLLENKKLWEEGIIKAISRNVKTLDLISNYFKNFNDKPYLELKKLLENLRKHYK
ncbi:MAG: hypothetical protein NC925_01430 [Candidatus Omnitrophica bacterium]|nr:hypothetical protein [Candidatus Omnitrophota bacterium]